jgi:hypothetical protein
MNTYIEMLSCIMLTFLVIGIMRAEHAARTLMEENPEVFLGILGSLIIILVVAFIFDLVSKIKER